MEARGMEIRFGSRSVQAAARKLLAGNGEPTPAELAPSSAPSVYVCRDMKSGAIVHCQNPNTLLIIAAGMSCMTVLVTIAIALLCWSVVRQRRLERRRHESPLNHELIGIAPPSVPANSPEFDDAVLVQLPGDEKPQFFAVPKPFHTDTSKDIIKPADVASDGQFGPKQPSSEADESCDPYYDSNPCVQSSDSLYRNPLFASH